MLSTPSMSLYVVFPTLVFAAHRERGSVNLSFSIAERDKVRFSKELARAENISGMVGEHSVYLQENLAFAAIAKVRSISPAKRVAPLCSNYADDTERMSYYAMVP